MKKKLLSLLLLACMLVSVFPLSAYAEGEEAETTPAENEVTYLDLYVKDGLVALFDAYSAKAGAGVKATSWAPVDFYGKEGYDSYVNPEDFAAGTLVDPDGGYLSFRWADGYLESYNESPVTKNTMDTTAYLDLSPLIELLGGDSTYSVQEVIQYVRPSNPNFIIELNEDRTVAYNWGSGYEGFSGSFYGCMNFGPCYWQATSGIVNQPIETVLAPTYKNIFINNEYYTGMNGNVTVYLEDGTSKGSWSVNVGPIAVNERTVTRVAMDEDENGKYTAKYNIHWHFATVTCGNDYNVSYTNQAANTNLKLLNGMPSRIYAVRVYNKQLNGDEYNQNHFADLVGYFGLDAGYLASVAESFGDGVSEFYAAFKDLSCKESKDTIEAKVAEIVFGLIASSAGTAIRSDMKADGLRYYVDVNMAGLDLVMAAGTTVEIGTLVSVSGNTPVLEDYDSWDYKVVGYDANGGKSGFFIDEDTYAVTIRYNNAGKAELKTKIAVRNYIILNRADGESVTLYIDNPTESIYDVYVRMNDAQITNAVSGLWDYVFDRIAVAERK